jgi:hypothetical protein
MIECVNYSKCGTMLNPNRVDTFWQKVEGWERKREQGGTNHVALRKKLDVRMCLSCMRQLQNGVDPGQSTLV